MKVKKVKNPRSSYLIETSSYTYIIMIKITYVCLIARSLLTALHGSAINFDWLKWRRSFYEWKYHKSGVYRIEVKTSQWISDSSHNMINQFTYNLLHFNTVLDASGEYAGGFFSGHNLRINADYCRELTDELTQLIAENKTTANDTETVPFFVQNVITKYKTFVEFKVSIDQFGVVKDEIAMKCFPLTDKLLTNWLIIFSHTLQQRELEVEIVQSACLPLTCGYNDLYQILSYVSFISDDEIIMHRTELVDFRILHGHYKFYLDSSFTLIV